MFSENETALLQEMINAEIQRYARRRKSITEDNKADHSQGVWVELLQTNDLMTLMSSLRKMISRHVNAVTNRGRHSVSDITTNNVSPNGGSNGTRKPVYVFNESDLQGTRLTDTPDQSEEDYVLLNLPIGTTKSSYLGLNFNEPEKNSKNWWSRTFTDLSLVTSALQIINGDLVFQLLSSDDYLEGCQIVGDKFGNANCPICGGRKCFTIIRHDNNWFTCYCYKENTHHREPPNSEREDNLPNLFNLFVGGPIRATQKTLRKLLIANSFACD